MYSCHDSMHLSVSLYRYQEVKVGQQMRQVVSQAVHVQSVIMMLHNILIRFRQIINCCINYIYTQPTIGTQGIKGTRLYADLHHSTNPPAPPLPAELVPVQYATVKIQTDSTKAEMVQYLYIH